MTSLVVYWSESLTTNHEVPGSIPGAVQFSCCTIKEMYKADTHYDLNKTKD